MALVVFHNSGTWRWAKKYFVRPVLAVLLIGTSLMATQKFVAPETAEAQAVPACGTNGTPTVVAQHGPTMYIDSGVGINASYVAYTIRAGVSSRNGMWMSLTNFSGGIVGLAPGESANQLVPTLASGASDTRYYLLAATGATVTPQTHTITLWQGPPDTGTAICTQTGSLRAVSETIKALANKVDSITSDVPSGQAKIGQAVTVVVQGRTGTLGAGPADDPGILSLSPSALTSFPAQAWRLEHTQISISPDGAAAPITLTDRLYLPGASGPDRPYTAQYTFRAVGESSAAAAIKPIQYIASGTQVKHTDLGAVALGNLPPISGTASMTVQKTASVSSLVRAPSLSSAERTVVYTVTITNTGDGTGTLDKLVDVIPSGSSYVSGSSQIAGRTVANPSYDAGTRQLTWPGPLRIPPASTLTVTYSLLLPDSVGLYTNAASGYFGNTAIDSTASISDVAPATASVEIRSIGATVTAVNDTATTNAMTTVRVNVTANDSTTLAGRTLTVASVGTVTNGTASVVSASSIDYTPKNNWSGTETFSYTVGDGISTASANVTVTVKPKAVPDVYSGTPPARNASSSFSTVTANDSCSNCSVSRYTPVSGDGITADTGINASNGVSLTLNSNGTFSITNNAQNAPNTVIFSYRVTDTGTGQVSSPVNVTIYLAELVPDYYTTPFNTAITRDISANDAAVGGTLQINTNPSNGTASLSGSNMTYTPNSTFWGIDSLGYKKGSVTSTVTYLVGPSAVTRQTIPNQIITGTLASANCPNCLFEIVTAPSIGALTLNTDGTYSYVAPSTSANTATYRVTHPTSGLSINGTLNLNVGPSAQNDSATVLLPSTGSGNVQTNDVCAGTCTTTVTVNPAFGSLSLSTNGAWTFNPNGEVGTATFTYSLASSLAPTVTSTATVTILVEGTANDSATTDVDRSVVINVLANDPCVGCTLTSTSVPSRAAIVGTNVVYTPPTGFTGKQTFTYTVTKNARTSTSTVTVLVNPLVVDDNGATMQSIPVDVDVLANDTCADCTITAVTNGSKGTVQIIDGLFVRYTPTGLNTGLDQFQYTVTDSNGRTGTATVVMTIAVAPQPANDQAITDANTAIIIDVSANDSGCNDCVIDKMSDPSTGSAAVRADGSIQFVPGLNASGTFTFTYSATDRSTGLFGTATVTVTVRPQAINDSARTAVGQSTTVQVLLNDSCTTCQVSIVTSPSGGSNSASVSSNRIVFTPSSTFRGRDTVGYRVTDSVTGLTATATVTIDVDDAAPDAAATPYNTQVTVNNVLSNDVCSGCSVKRLRNYPQGKGTSQLSGNSVIFTPSSGVTGLVTFDYDADPTGGSPDSTSYAMTDSQFMSQMQSYGEFGDAAAGPMTTTTVSSSVTILVGPNGQTYSVNTYGTKSGDIISNTDPTAAISDSNCLGCYTELVTPPASGEITLNSDGTWTYKAPATATTDSMTYKVVDPVTGVSVNGTITFVVSEIPTPVMSVVKSAGTINRAVVAPSTRVDAGDTIPFTITVSNTGNVTLNNIVVSDPGLTSVSCSATSLARNTSMTCTGTHVITQSEIDDGLYVNTVTVTSTEIPSPGVSTSVGTSLARTSGISFSKTADQATLPAPGQSVTYTMTATNTGNVTLTGISVSDPGVTSVSCDRTTLLPGQTATCTGIHVVTQAEFDSGSYTNTALVTSESPPGVVNPSNSASVTLQSSGQAAIVVTATSGTVDNSVVSPTNRTDAGDSVPFTTIITNTGAYSLSNISLTDARISSYSCSPSLVGPLASGAFITCTGTWTITQAALNSGSITDVVSVSASAANGSTVSDTDSRSVSLVRTATLSIEKTASSGTTLPATGQSVTYTLVARNTGNVTLTAATISDPMLPGLTCTGGNGQTLAPNATMTCSGSYTVTSFDTAAGSLTNTGSVSATAPSGMTNPSASTSLTLQQVVPASISITATAASPANSVVAPTNRTDAGDTVLLTTTITNTGPHALSSIVLTDAIGTPSCTPTIGTTLNAGESMVCTGYWTISQSGLDNGGRTDTISVSATASTGETPTDSTSRVISLLREPQIAIEKSTTTSQLPAAGSTITYSFLLTNKGNVSLSSPAISDPLIATITCPTNDGVLDPNETLTCSGNYVVTQSDESAGSLSNTASVSATWSGGTATASDSVTITSLGTLSIEVTSVVQSRNDAVVAPSSRSDAGDKVVIRTTITNTGDVALSSLSITDSTIASTCFNLSGVTLAPGESISCDKEVTLTQALIDAGSQSSTVNVSGSASSITATASTNRSFTIAQIPSLSLVKSTLETQLPSVGSTISYSLVATNSGNVTLSGGSITDPSVDDSSCPSAVTLAPGQTMTCTATYEVTQTDIDAGHFDNTATASATAPDSSMVSDSDSVRLNSSALAAVTIESQAAAPNNAVAGQPTRTDAGDTILITTRIRNTGERTLRSLVSTDDELSGMCATELSGLVLAPGEEVVCTRLVTITQSMLDSGSMSANVDVDGQTLLGANVTASTTRSYSLVRIASISFDKQTTTANFEAVGDQIDYELRAVNTGNVSLRSVNMTDLGVAALSCSPSATLLPDNGDLTNNNEWAICLGTHTVTSGDVLAGSYTNTATVTALVPDGMNSLMQSDSVTVSSSLLPAIAIATEVIAEDDTVVSPSTRPDAGDTRTIRTTITNTGTADLSSITLTDPLFPNACSVALSTLTLAPGDVFTCLSVHTITQSNLNAGTIANSLSTSGTASSGAVVSASTSRSIPLLQQMTSRLVVSLSTDGNCPGPYREIAIDAPFTVTVCFELINTGNTTITSASLVASTGDSPALRTGQFPLGPGQSAMYSMERPFNSTVNIVGSGNVMVGTTPATPTPDNVDIRYTPISSPTNPEPVQPTPANPTLLPATGNETSTPLAIAALFLTLGAFLVATSTCVPIALRVRNKLRRK